MTPDRWERIRAVLDEALHLAEDARTSFVESACGGDPLLCADILELLAISNAADAAGFLKQKSSVVSEQNGKDGITKDRDTDPIAVASTSVWPKMAKITDAGAPVKTPASKLQGRRFEIQRECARGGLGIVYLAFDRELGREVAVKEMREQYLDVPSARLRFTREAEITDRLEHPGIAPVYSFGQYEDGRPYNAMKLVSGESMDKVIRHFHGKSDGKGNSGNGSLRRRLDFASFDFKRLLRHFASLCNTIEYAHEKGYLHRDIKPENIHLGELGETIVLDWGLAKPLEASGPDDVDHVLCEMTPMSHCDTEGGSTRSATQPGDIFGTPAFMSPEQAAGDHGCVGPASDIFSLGSMLFCLLAGNAPLHRLEGESVADVLARLRTGDWARPLLVLSSIPRPLAAICEKAMALAPEDRYATAGALAEDVERYLADEETSVWKESVGERIFRWQRRYPGLRMGLMAAITVLLICVIGLSWLAVNLNRARRAESVAKDEAGAEAQRASFAEQETRREAAGREAESLRRAAARGAWQAVLVGLESRLLAEQEDPIQIALWRIEALEALDRGVESRQVVHDLISRNDLGTYRAEVLLWQADANRVTGTSHVKALIHEAIEAGLSPADQAYARALIAKTIPEAITYLPTGG